MTESAKDTVESAKEAAKNAAESAKNTVDSAKEAAKNAAESAKNTVDSAADKVSNVVGNVVPIPSQPHIEPQSDAHTLKSRLEWGEPAFTILDVSDRQTYNQGHIMGAMPMPLDQLVERAEPSLAKSRDIYVYGENDQKSAEAAQLLTSAGFEHVSQLRGGLAAWKEIGGPTEGIAESRTPAGADDYNVVARLQNHAETQKKDV